MFSPSFKESAPLISIVAPSILASASISKFFTQYSNVSIEYSYMLDINSGVKGSSTTSPFWFVYFIINFSNASSFFCLVTFNV